MLGKSVNISLRTPGPSLAAHPAEAVIWVKGSSLDMGNPFLHIVLYIPVHLIIPRFKAGRKAGKGKWEENGAVKSTFYEERKRRLRQGSGDDILNGKKSS